MRLVRAYLGAALMTAYVVLRAARHLARRRS